MCPRDGSPVANRPGQVTDLHAAAQPSAPTVSAYNWCAIVVTWQPDLNNLSDLMRTLVEQGCAVRVIDNGSDNAAALQEMCAGIGIMHDRAPATVDLWGRNQGLAHALNAGLEYARDHGYSHALLFDQDSRVGAGFCQSMAEAWQQAQHHCRQPVAALGPRLQDPDTARQTPFRKFRLLHRSDHPVAGTTGLYDTDFLITSGTLLSLAALEHIGLMKDDYFIDNIDLEWCFRARAQGYALCGTDHAVLYHRIGETSRNPLVRAGIMVSHSPLRSYYSTRNRLHLRRQSYAPRDWRWRDSVRFALKSLWLVLFTGQRRRYFSEIRRGIRDARDIT